MQPRIVFPLFCKQNMDSMHHTFAHVPIALHQETQIHFAFAVAKYDLPCFILNFCLTLLKDILMVENETKCRKPQCNGFAPKDCQLLASVNQEYPHCSCQYNFTKNKWTPKLEIHFNLQQNIVIAFSCFRVPFRQTYPSSRYSSLSLLYLDFCPLTKVSLDYVSIVHQWTTCKDFLWVRQGVSNSQHHMSDVS